MSADKWEGLKGRLGGPAGLDPVCSGSRAGFGGRERSDCARLPGKTDCPSLLQKPSTDQPLCCSSLRGPAASGCDCVAEGLWLPQLHVGDWLVFENMGAYTVGMGSLLRGAQTCHITYAMSRVAW